MSSDWWIGAQLELFYNNDEVGITKFSLELSRRVQVNVPPEITSKLKARSLARLRIADGMVKGAVPLFELVTDAEPRYNHYRKLGYSFYRLKEGIVQKEK